MPGTSGILYPVYLAVIALGLLVPTLSKAQTLNLGNVPLSVCVDAPINLNLLPTPGVDLTAVGLAITASTTSGTLAVSALGPNGALTITGGQLTAGNNQPITIRVSLAGFTLASATFTINVVQPAIPTAPPTLTATIGSVLSLSGLCPTGVLVNLSNLTDLTGIINIPTTTAGVQSLSILCLDAGCLSPVRVVTATVLPILFNVLSNAPVCLGQPLSLTVVPDNFSLFGNNPLVSISVTGPAGLTVSALDANGVLTITGLASGVNNLSVVASIAGTPVATVGLTATANPVPDPVAMASLTVLEGTTVSLTALCPTAIVSTTGIGGTTVPLLSLPPTTVGVQVLPLLCATGSGSGSGNCVSPITSVTVITLPVPTIGLIPSALQVCINNPVSLTVTGLTLPFGLSVLGVSSAGIMISNNVITVTGLPVGPTTLTVNAGLTLAGIPVIAAQTVTITVLDPAAPTVVTQGGQAYPAGLNSLSVTQNSPSVLFNASCSSGALSYTSSTGTTGSTSPITVPTTALGAISYTVVCTNGACVSPATVVSVTVVTAPLVNQNPTVVGGGIQDPQSATVGVGFSSTVSGAFTDPDGNPLTFTASNLPPGLGISPSGVISGTPTVSGPFVVTVTANDGQGGTVSDSFTLNVAPNGAPVITTPGDQSLTVNVPASFTVVATDPEGSTVTYAATGLPPSLTIDPTTGVVTGTPSVTGTFPVVVTVTDPQGNTSTVGLNVIVNPAPVVNQAPVLSGTPLVSPQSATVGIGFSTSTAQAFTDPEGQPLIFSVSGLPNGVAINPNTGVISGAPSVSGMFGVVVTATDPQGASVATGFTLNVAPAAPVVGGPLAATVVAYNCQTGAITFGRVGGDSNRPVEFMAIGVRGYSTDPNGVIESGLRADANQSTITVMARYVGDANSQVQFVFNFRAFCAGTPPANQPPTYTNGSLTNQTGTVGVPFSYGIPANAFVDPEGQPLTYSALNLPPGLSLTGSTISGTPSVSGVYGVTITATDPQGATATGNFTVTINPAAPVVGGPLAATVVAYNCQTGAITFGRVGGDSNRPVEFMAIGVRGYSTDPNGVIESGLRADANQSTITVMARYVGDANSQVQFVFNFRAFCAGTTPTNQPPTYTNGSLTNQTGTVGVPFSYGIPAGAFTDPEGQPLTYSALNLPPGLSLTGSTISGTPSVSGVYGVTITATDPQGATATGNFTVTINPAAPGNQPPIVAGTIPNQTATAGASFSYAIPAGTFTDPEGQTLTYSVSGLPRGLGFSGNTFSGVPTQEGQFLITVTAFDPQGNSASTTFMLTVIPSNLCGSDPATFGQPLQVLQPTYNCQTGTIKFNVRGGNGSVIEFGAIGITPFQTNCFETMDHEVAQDVRDDKSNVEPFQIMARQNGQQTTTYAFDARAYCRSGGAGNPNGAGRLSVLEPMAGLQVTVFGNPTIGNEVEVEIAGAEGKPLTLRVADGLGKVIGQQFTQKAGATQRYMVPVGKSAGMYFLQVSTPTQVQTVKIVRQ